MCKTTNNGYKLNNGAELKITEIHPDDIPEPVRKELEQSPASQLDILYIRASNHRNAKQIDDLNTNIQEIGTKLDTMIETFTKQLKVVVVNGKEEERPITELIGELWEQHHDKRNVSIIRKFIYHHRRKFLAAGIIFLVISVVFKEYLHIALEWIGDNFLEIMKWIF